MVELGDRAAEAIRGQQADFAAKLELRPGVVAWDCLEAAIQQAGAKLKRGESIRSVVGLVMHLAGEYVVNGLPPAAVSLAPKQPESIWQDLTNYEGM